MPGAAKSDIKLGFWIAVGFLLLALVLVAVQMILSKVRSQAG